MLISTGTTTSTAPISTIFAIKTKTKPEKFRQDKEETYRRGQGIKSEPTKERMLRQAPTMHAITVLFANPGFSFR